MNPPSSLPARGVAVAVAAGVVLCSIAACLLPVDTTQSEGTRSDPSHPSPTGAGAAADSTGPHTANVLTQHNNNNRSGLNDNEVVLTRKNVGSGSGKFGLLYDVPLDDANDPPPNTDRAVDPSPDNVEVYAQPLFVSQLNITQAETSAGMGVHDVVIVATEKNSVYALDAVTGMRIWQLNAPQLGRPAHASQLPGAGVAPMCGDLVPWVGITATPVIDPDTQMLYFVTKVSDAQNSFYKHILRQVDLHTGQLVKSQEITGGAGGQTFVPRIELNRAGLLLANGRIYVAFSGHCDSGPYHGWVMAYDENTLAQKAIWNATSSGVEGGIWQAGAGLVADAGGNVYLMTGNGTFNPTGATNTTNLGSSYVKLDQNLNVLDRFTPHNAEVLQPFDIDTGASGPIIVPGTNLLVGGGKTGAVYVLNTQALGGYLPPTAAENGTAASVLTFPASPLRLNPDFENKMAKVHGRLWQLANADAGTRYRFYGSLGLAPNLHGSPAFFPGQTVDAKGNKKQGAMYTWTEEDFLKQYTYNGKTFDTVPVVANDQKILAQPVPNPYTTPVPNNPVRVTKITGMPGGFLSLSSNGTNDGILWVTHPLRDNANLPHARFNGILAAYDASDVRVLLWDSEMNVGRDRVNSFSKFCPPTVANGRVYVATFSGMLKVYGLLPAATSP